MLFVIVAGARQAHLSLSRDRVQPLTHFKGAFLARMRALGGRVALRLLYDPVMRGGGKLDKRLKWAWAWGIHILPHRAPRKRKPIGRAVDARFYSDACAMDGGLAAVAFFSNRGDEFLALPKWASERELIEETNEIVGLEMFAMVAAAVVRQLW